MLNLVSYLLFFSQTATLTDSVSKAYKELFYLKIDSLQKTKNLQNGYLGLSVKKCNMAEAIFGYNSGKAMKPASTLKLITTSTALALLGEKFIYQTFLEYSGTIRNDTLFGSIYIRGTGDPTLGSWRFPEKPNHENLFEKWAIEIKKIGIKVISGNVIPNSSYFSGNSMPDSWVWGDIGNYYGAGSFGLNINENQYRANFSTAKKSGDISTITRITPQLPDIELINSVIGDNETKGDAVNFYSSPLSNTILASGSLPSNKNDFGVKGSIPNPPELCAYLLKKALGKIGVEISNKIKYESNLSENKIIIIEKSPTLFEICLNTNFESINLYAECLLKTIAANKSQNSTTESGVELLTNYWKNKGVDLKGFYIKDGSGLSVNDYITPNNMTSILALATKEPFFDAFYQGIPVVGEDGTVKNIAKKSLSIGNFRAKSGTIEKVKSYAGYFTNKKGELMSFSIMANQFDSSESAMSRELVKLFDLMVGLE
jgi:serine-type D-Ala-D-Ala carboxypeptidase/endopeptidase (penicillin-binding protein 4)